MDAHSSAKHHYPSELKAEVIRQVQELSKSVPVTAEAFQISPASIYRWLVETNGPSLRMRQRNLQEFRDEISRLKTESARLEEERDLLFRTVQVFARLS